MQESVSFKRQKRREMQRSKCHTTEAKFCVHGERVALHLALSLL